MSRSIVDFIAAHGEEKGNHSAFTFVDDQGEHFQLSFSELHNSARSIAQHLLSKADSGSVVVLLYPQGLEYVQAFIGCLYAGIIAVPLYPPANDKHYDRVMTVVKNSDAALALTTAELKSKLVADLGELPIVGFDEFDFTSPISAQVPLTFSGEQLAFLQYTSGSTGTPKGVMISHGNILANLESLQQATCCSSKDIFCNWLPLFHDLGLVNTVLLP